MNIYEKIAEAVLNGDRKYVVELINSGLSNNLKPIELLNNGLIKGMDKVAEEWKENNIFIPEVLVAARAMSAGNKILEELLTVSDKEDIGTVIIGTVKGDLHDIGKNLVTMMLKGKGFKVIDLGVDVSKEQFVDATKEYNATYVCMSTLLTTTMEYFKEIIDEYKINNLREKVKIFIGGAPITQDYADSIGADAYTNDAVSAAKLMFELATN